MAILTDTKARNIRPTDPQLPHGGVVGLVLIPGKLKGHGKWVLRYVSPATGKRRNAGLGTYPEIGIAEVGRLGSAMREQLSGGLDPLEQKKTDLPQQRPPSFREASESIHKELSPGWKNKKHAQQWINTLEQYAYPEIGSLMLDQIQPRHIADVLRPIWLSKPETASRLKQRLHAVMAWGWAHEYCAANPVDVVHHLLPQQPSKAIRIEHQPAMPWQKLPEFIALELRLDGGIDLTRMMLELLILTAARSGEIRAMRWSEVDLAGAIWTIPAERMKAKQQHRVPLSKRAIEILKQLEGMKLHDEFVFPSLRSRRSRKDASLIAGEKADDREPIFSDMVLTAFLRRAKAPSSTAGRVATAHGFRSSFRDWCSEHGYARDLAERALAHTVSNKVEAAYHRTDLLEQRRPLMDAWGAYCSSTSCVSRNMGLASMLDPRLVRQGRQKARQE